MLFVSRNLSVQYPFHVMQNKAKNLSVSQCCMSMLVPVFVSACKTPILEKTNPKTPSKVLRQPCFPLLGVIAVARYFTRCWRDRVAHISTGSMWPCQISLPDCASSGCFHPIPGALMCLGPIKERRFVHCCRWRQVMSGVGWVIKVFLGDPVTVRAIHRPAACGSPCGCGW